MRSIHLSHRGIRLCKLPFVALICSLVAACSHSAQRGEVPLPALSSSWSSRQSSAPSLAQELTISERALSQPWWSLFGDKTLENLEQRALQANLDLQSALLRFAQSRAQRQTVAAQHGPQVVLGAHLERERTSENGASTRVLDALPRVQKAAVGASLKDPFPLYQAGFDASWELDLWGRIARSVEAADAQIQAAGALLEQAQLCVAAEVARNYFELRNLQQQLQLLDEQIAISSQLLALAQARRESGLTDEFELQQRQSAFSSAQSQRPQLLAQQAARVEALALLTAAEPGELVFQFATSQPLPKIELPDLALGLPSELLRKRPDLRAAENELDAATAHLGIAVADLYPRLTLGATFGFESCQGSKFGEWGSRTWQIGPSLHLPLFDQGRRRSLIVLRELEQQQVAVTYQQAVLKAWHEVDEALTYYSAQRQCHTQLQSKLQSHHTIYEICYARYNSGLTDLLSPLEAQSSELQSRRELCESEQRLLASFVAIHKAVASPVKLPPLSGASPPAAPEIGS